MMATTTGPVRRTMRFARTAGASTLPTRTAMTVTGTTSATATPALYVFQTKGSALSLK